MKNFVLILCILGISKIASAQWTTSGSDIYSSNGGNVGIGTTSPASKLAVYGDGNGTGAANTQLIIVNTNTGAINSSTAARIGFHQGNGTTNNGEIAYFRDAYDTFWMNNVLGDGPIQFAQGGSPKMTVTSAGKVGIGTTNPSEFFQVENNHDGATMGFVKNTQSSANAYSGFLASAQNQSVEIIANSDGLSRSYPGFHPSSTLIYGSATNGLNIISDVGSGSTGANTGIIRFITYSGSGGVTSNTSGNDAFTRMVIIASGNVGIGTTSPTEKLSVNGKIRAKEIKVETGWSDFVFEPAYKLRGLKETEQFIKENKHLPEIPSAKEVAENGINLGEMNAKLLQKIEELTLYVIEQNKRLDTQQKEIDQLKSK